MLGDCPRVLTKEQMIAGLKAGKALMVDRRDAPELPELLEMEAQGLVESELLEFDEQSSALRFVWKEPKMTERTWADVRLEKSGNRWKIFARKEEGEDWVEVESVIGLSQAEEMADELEDDDEMREEWIDESINSGDGKD